MTTPDLLALFEARRPFLTGLAYRLLGSVAEAEDAVQDTYIKWSQADHASVQHPAAWLTTVCTRHCIDLLRTAQQTRVDYVGAWLPEPIQATTEDDPAQTLALSSSLSMAFLLLLERLAPKERAAYLLYEVFEQPYAEVARVLDLQETACRKLVSRARLHVGRANTAQAPVPPARQQYLLDAFQTAIASGEVGPLARMMAEDVALRADGGGKVQTLLEPLLGKHAVLDFIRERLGLYWRHYDWTQVTLNGVRGVVLCEHTQIQAAVSFACNAEGQLTDIFIVRNPDKLARLAGGG